jgi:hypothetical protein
LDSRNWQFLEPTSAYYPLSFNRNWRRSSTGRSRV